VKYLANELVTSLVQEVAAANALALDEHLVAGRWGGEGQGGREGKHV